MEQRTILNSTTIVGISWAVFALITYFFANFSIGEIEKATFILFPHIAFFVMFISGIFLLGVCYLKKLKYEQEKKKLEDEYGRKREWEEFQFNLYREERLEKQRYDTIKTLIEKLDDKDVKKENALKEEIESFRKEMEEWKKSKDKQFFVEIKNSSKTKKS